MSSKKIAASTSSMIAVTEQSQIGEARRRAVDAAMELGFDETRRGEVAIVASELATNLIKHTANGGSILLNRCLEANESELEIISLDQGQGLVHVDKALRDGFSTAGSLGTGLGAVRRLSRAFDIYSRPGKGTIIAARMSPRGANKNDGWPSCAGIAIPLSGEPVSGDAWALVESESENLLAVADGLGHGLEAADAAKAAIDVIISDPGSTPSGVLTKAHGRVRGTRGAAVSVVKTLRDKIICAGLGNVAVTLCNQEKRQRLLTHDGTLGFEARRIRQYEYDRESAAVLVLSSDGCSNRWDLNDYPGLLTHCATIVCAVLFHDSARKRDDATMVVLKLM